MMSARIAPSLAKQAQMRFSLYQPVLLQSVTTVRLSTCSNGNQLNSYGSTGVIVPASVAYTAVLKPSNNIILRRSNTTSPESKDPKLPTAKELEQGFFRIVVVIWDLVYKIAVWAWAMFKKKVVLNSTVQLYWKKFNSRLDVARKS